MVLFLSGGVMYEMSKKKGKTIRDIKNDIDNPTVIIDLSEEEEEFLKVYATNRISYTERSFDKEEARITRRILDRIFYQYVMLHENADFNLTTEINNLILYRDKHREEKKNIQKLGEKLSEQNSGDWTRRD